MFFILDKRFYTMITAVKCIFIPTEEVRAFIKGHVKNMKKIPQREICERISQLDGIVGLYVESLESGEIFEINPNHVFCSASTIKIPILALLLKDVDAGKLDWKAKIPLSKRNRVGGTGILSKLDEDYEPTLEKLALLMIILSDNTATNQIVDLIGLNRITEFCKELGYTHTRCERKQMDLQAIADGLNNYTSAGDIGRMLSAIAKGNLVSANASKTIHTFMSKQMCCNKLPSRVPAVPCFWPDEERVDIKPNMVLVANKTGDFFQVEHDVGIFTLPDGRQYIIAVLTGEITSAREAIESIADVSRIVYDAMK